MSRFKEAEDLWGRTVGADEWVIFHDESYCEETNFLYHGFLFVRKRNGRQILSDVLVPNQKFGDTSSKKIHFTDLRGWKSVRSHVARAWVELAKNRWLIGDGLKFYCFGVNKNNLNYSLWSGNTSEKVYSRFYEIGLNSSLALFQINPNSISHFFFDQGKQDIDRYNKALQICGLTTIVKALDSDCLISKQEISKFLQLTDVLLGTIRKSFTSVSEKKDAQKQCVKIFADLIARFNNQKRAYNIQSRYWRKFGLGFFPSRGDLSAQDFFQRNIEYYRTAGRAFYCDRPSWEEEMKTASQPPLFENT